MLYRLEHVRLGFAGRGVLRDVTLQHNPGEKLVLLGRNGSGKTTLLRLIAGEADTDGGVVERARGLELGRLEQRLQAPPGTTVLQFCLGAFPELLAVEAEIAELEPRLHAHDEPAAARFHELQEKLERLDGYRARPRAEAALDAVGLPAAYRARTLDLLSGGERTRVALVRALLSKVPLLLLDEPTNHLDLLGVEFLAKELATRDGAFLLVTHDRELVDRVGGEILELHGGRLEHYPGGYDRYRRARAERREQARKAYELQRIEIARQEEFIRRNIAGQNTRQAQARQKLLDKMARLEAPEPDLGAIRLRWPSTTRSGDRVLDVHDVAVGWDAPLVKDVTFYLQRGERLAIVGRNGTGKTTLLQSLSGQRPALSGGIRFGTGVAPASYDQEHADVPTGVSVLDALAESRPDWTPAEARAWAGRFGFSGDAAEGKTDSLSGGERARLSLARLLAAAPNLMLLDEPTNHLDVPTCEVLEAALEDFPGALVLVSHDRRLVERVATRVLLLEGGGAVPINSVPEAFARLGLSAQGAGRREQPAGEGLRRSAVEQERRLVRRDARKARERADALVDDLHAVESRLSEIDALLCEREVFSDAARAGALAREGEALRGQLDELLEAWTTAEEDAEALQARLSELDAASDERTTLG